MTDRNDPLFRDHLDPGPDPVITDAPRRVIEQIAARASELGGEAVSTLFEWEGSGREEDDIVEKIGLEIYDAVISAFEEAAAPVSLSPSERREEIARALWESDETLYLESGRLPWEKATPGDRAAAYRRADAILSLPAPAPAPVSFEGWAESIVQSFDALVIDWSPLHEQRAEVLSGLRSILLASPPGAADLKAERPPIYGSAEEAEHREGLTAPSPDQPSEGEDHGA